LNETKELLLLILERMDEGGKERFFAEIYTTDIYAKIIDEVNPNTLDTMLNLAKNILIKEPLIRDDNLGKWTDQQPEAMRTAMVETIVPLFKKSDFKSFNNKKQLNSLKKALRDINYR
jgi:hypothetical protein